MKLVMILLAFVAMLVVSVHSFAGSEDKFLKKYAMMKIYESCFGEDVVKQIRKEMKMACAKCASLEPPMSPSPTSAPATQDEQRPQSDEQNNPAPHPGTPYNGQPPFDTEKLHQAILAFRPNAVAQPSFRPYGGLGPSGFYNPYANSPFSAVPQMFYPGFQQVPFSPYSFPLMGQQQYFGNRMSRDMDFRGQMEILSSKMSGRARNVTCILQELGYLDENLEPNFVKISERISNLPISEGLRKDMQDGVSFCQQFSQCVPEIQKEKAPLSRDFIRPMFFFKCYKHKKLEACIMKDVRDKYPIVDEDEPEGDFDFRRTGKATKLPGDETEREIDEMATSMYEFLYASDSGFDIDGLL